MFALEVTVLLDDSWQEGPMIHSGAIIGAATRLRFLEKWVAEPRPGYLNRMRGLEPLLK